MATLNPRDRDRIQAELVRGDSVRTVADRHGLSKSAVGRLRQTMGRKIAQLQASDQYERVEKMLGLLGRISAETRRVYKRCVDTGDYSTALRALARHERQLAMMGTLLGLQGSPVVGGQVIEHQADPTDSMYLMAQVVTELWSLMTDDLQGEQQQLLRDALIEAIRKRVDLAERLPDLVK